MVEKQIREIVSAVEFYKDQIWTAVQNIITLLLIGIYTSPLSQRYFLRKDLHTFEKGLIQFNLYY